MGVVKERISEIIYEHIIKPGEPEYEKRFNANLDILTKNRVLFSKQDFDFHDIKKKITSLGNYRTQPEEFSAALNINESVLLFADLTDMGLIRKILEAGNLLYLVYEDLNSFYYMLLSSLFL